MEKDREYLIRLQKGNQEKYLIITNVETLMDIKKDIKLNSYIEKNWRISVPVEFKKDWGEMIIKADPTVKRYKLEKRG